MALKKRPNPRAQFHLRQTLAQESPPKHTPRHLSPLKGPSEAIQSYDNGCPGSQLASIARPHRTSHSPPSPSSRELPPIPRWTIGTGSTPFSPPQCHLSPRRPSPKRRHGRGIADQSTPASPRPPWVAGGGSTSAHLLSSPRQELPAIAQGQHPQLLRRLEQPLPAYWPAPPLMAQCEPRPRPAQRRTGRCWALCPTDVWQHIVSLTSDSSALWRLVRTNHELRQLGLRGLYERALQAQEDAAAQLEAAGPLKPLNSRIEERQADILRTMNGLAGCLTKEGYQQMRSYRSPCAVIEAIVGVCCLVVNHRPLPALDTPRKKAWLLAPEKLELMQHFVARADYQPSLQIRQALLQFVLRPEHTPGAVEHVSAGAAQYCQWLHHLHDYWEILRSIHQANHSKYQQRLDQSIVDCRKLAQLVGLCDVVMRAKTAKLNATRGPTKQRSIITVLRPPTRVIQGSPRAINTAR